MFSGLCKSLPQQCQGIGLMHRNNPTDFFRVWSAVIISAWLWVPLLRSLTRLSAKSFYTQAASAEQEPARPQLLIFKLPLRFPKMAEHHGAPGAIS